MTDELQFDSSLGGKQELPEKLTLLYFTSARAKEIQEMKQSLKAPTGTKMAFQRLPKHMRRRIMSHNAKRLPRRLREIHLSQLKKSGLPPKQKRQSRKYRRRPYNLINEYARRQGKYSWLETHIWHAKRFHMIQKWGYRLPERPCDKSFRACYRATTKYCNIQDISYFKCIEISGIENVLVEGFKMICDSKLGLTIGAKAFIQGNREGQLMLFNNSHGCNKPIGTVNFHWSPTNNSLNRSLWLWVHAAFYLEVLNLLQSVFCLNLVESGKYINSITKVSLTEICLNRFRLTGPGSHAVLQNMLQLPSESCNTQWFKDYILNPINLELYRKQCEYWKNFESSEFPPNGIISLNILDPRHNMPKIRTKPTNSYNKQRIVQLPDKAALGPIWENEIRTSIRINKISNSKLAEMRSELLVPGSDLENGADVIPIMLIARPGTRHDFIGYGSGWDLIVPSGWGNTFWISLIMWGARAGGLREFNSIRFESGLTPYLEPDTHAGKEEEKTIKEKYEQGYFSLPPNKRPNYTKLGIVQPFSLNWKILIQDWNSNEKPADNFKVLREKSKLKTIQDFLCNKIKNLDVEEVNTLIPVRLKMEQRGIAKQFSLICLPKPSDLISKQMVLEPLKDDINQKLRKEMRHNHKALLKKMRRKRIIAKRNKKSIPKDLTVLNTYKEEMHKLWLPSINGGIRASCSRELMGFIVSGNFSFLHAKSCAVGYITIGALKSLGFNKCRNKVLVRNITSRVYRRAILEVIV